MHTPKIYFLSLTIFTGLLFFIPESFIPPDLGNTILTIVTFLFGIIAGFYIVVTTTDYNSIKNILAEETAGLISLHQNILIYDKKTATKLANLIDSYVIRTFDFEIVDYASSTHDEFEEIVKLTSSIPLKKKSSVVFEKIREIMNEMIVTRQQLTVLGTKTLSLFQWLILVALGALVIASLYGLRSGELFFDVVTVVLASSIILILLLIRDLDFYIWNERTFGFDIFENVLRSIGKTPYYPAESIKKGRVNPPYKKYRIGEYTDSLKNHKRVIKTYVQNS